MSRFKFGVAAVKGPLESLPMTRVSVDGGSLLKHVVAALLQLTAEEAVEKISRLEVFTSYDFKGKAIITTADLEETICPASGTMVSVLSSYTFEVAQVPRPHPSCRCSISEPLAVPAASEASQSTRQVVDTSKVTMKLHIVLLQCHIVLVLPKWGYRAPTSCTTR